jgi:hypothetical protein
MQLGFLDDDDGLSLVGPAIHAGIVRQFQFVALRAERKSWGNKPCLGRSPHISSGS